MLGPRTSLSHHMLTSLARVSLAGLQGHEQHLVFSITTRQRHQEENNLWKVSVERTQLKKLTVSSQTGCRKTSMVTFSKAEAKPKLAELRGAVVELSVVPTPSGAQNHAHVICGCWYGSRTSKLSNENRRCLQWCCTDMIAVLLPLQPYKHCAAGILSEKNTLLWCNHISFPAFCKPNRLIS